ncbi:hypothetical protein [Ideonella sp. A 288]|uniref:hypothetical protein n=1 Tax=Ideonella sp. A 288 TaxID=1962181 RepID=UPI0018FEBE7D|nr:hypothetical protein [Ideonella sp. A 288]
MCCSSHRRQQEWAVHRGPRPDCRVGDPGLKEGGVGEALDKHNEKLATADMKKRVDAAKADIIAGKIKVADYMADNACKY